MPAKRKAATGKPARSARKPKPAAAPQRRRATPRKEAAADQVTVYCSRCGTGASTVRGGIPGGWSVGFAGGRLEYLCVACARANIRAIEGKLPEEWWE